MTPSEQTELRVKLAEWAANEEIKRRGITPIQNPPGSEGYRGADLSGLWILETREGHILGFNYRTPEEALEAFREEWAREHDLTSLDAVAELEARLLAMSRVGDKDSLFSQYIGHLGNICGNCKEVDSQTILTVWEAFAYSVVATALQRCLALAKTLNIELTKV
jgi:hypothetical protein